LDDNTLKEELLRMTDLHTELVAEGNWADAVVSAEVSRLVVDVERFREDKEESMAAVGMGAVYTQTHNQRIMRRLMPERREELLKRYYDPHHLKLEQTVDSAIARTGRCLIIDVHSFPSTPLPCDSDQDKDRPQICIGTDDYHTPVPLAKATMEFYRKQGYIVKQNSPFSGSIVPRSYYLKAPLVQSIMIEINRSIIHDEKTGAIQAGGLEILKGVRLLVEEVSAYCRQSGQ